MRENETEQLRKYSKRLKSEMTEAEKRLWLKLKNRQLNNVKFNRQRILGNYIVDFISFDKKLIIELDGGQHAEQQDYDEARSEYLTALGYRVIRFWNNEIFEEFDRVLEQLWELTTN